MEDLDVKSRLVIAKRLRYDYASTHKQIARLLRLDKSALEDFISLMRKVYLRDFDKDVAYKAAPADGRIAFG